MVDQKLLINVHEGLQEPTVSGTSYLTKGSFQYYHYSCDSFKDQVRMDYWVKSYHTESNIAHSFFRAGAVLIAPSNQWHPG